MQFLGGEGGRQKRGQAKVRPLLESAFIALQPRVGSTLRQGCGLLYSTRQSLAQVCEGTGVQVGISSQHAQLWGRGTPAWGRGPGRGTNSTLSRV